MSYSRYDRLCNFRRNVRTMKLKDNWKDIATKAHSMWAAYLGLAILVIPEAIFWLTGMQVLSPLILGYLGVLLLCYGVFGRLIDQGIEK